MPRGDLGTKYSRFAATRHPQFEELFSRKEEVKKVLGFVIAGSSLFGCTEVRDVSSRLANPSPAPDPDPNVGPDFAGIESIDQITSSSLLLHWRLPEGSAYFVVYRVGADGSLRVEGVTAGNVTSYAVSGLAAGTTYVFRVRAAGSDGVVDNNTRDLSATTLSTPVPSISNVEPPQGVAPGGYRIRVRGAGFQAGATVMLDNRPCAAPSFVDATEISCQVPAGNSDFDLRRVSVTVTNPDTQSATSPNAFLYVGSPLLWLDASQESTIVTRGTTASVVEWIDRSGQGNHAINAYNDATQPLYNGASSTRALNGRGTIAFSRDSATHLRVDPIGPLATAMSSSFTSFVVSRIQGSPVGQGTEAASGEFVRAGFGQLFSTLADGTATFGLRDTSGVAVSAMSAAGAIAQGRAYLKTMNYVANKVYGYVDSVEVPNSGVVFQGRVSGNTGNDPYFIGCSDPHSPTTKWHLSGDVGEILFFSPALDDTQRASVEAVLSTKWDLH